MNIKFNITNFEATYSMNQRKKDQVLTSSLSGVSVSTARAMTAPSKIY